MAFRVQPFNDAEVKTSHTVIIAQEAVVVKPQATFTIGAIPTAFNIIDFKTASAFFSVESCGDAESPRFPLGCAP